MLIIILFIVALILLLLASLGIGTSRVNLGWLGIFFAVLAVFLPIAGVH